MMLNYKSATGTEIQEYDGVVHFWMPSGVYTVRKHTMRKHGQYHGTRSVTVYMWDTARDVAAEITQEYPDTFDDYEIIHRWVVGSGKCDCVRGKTFYESKGHYECNKGSNRFILQKLVIKGENLNCIVKYRGYI